VTAATLRRAPLPVAVVAAGAVLAFAAVALVGGLVGREAWWAVVAGGFACASGLVLGSTRQAAPAGALALVAVAAVMLAVPAGDTRREAAFPALGGFEPPAGAVGGDRSVGADDDGRFRGDAGGRERSDGSVSLARLVRRYYAALDARQYRRAWKRLAPGVRVAFGGFEAWRAGYGTTLGHRVEDVRVGDGRVEHVLVATDRTPCGGVTERRFALSWHLDGGRAEALSATKLSGVDPAAAC
jgi:hypothetical protein